VTVPLTFVTASTLGKTAGVDRRTAASLARSAGVREVKGRFDPAPALAAIRQGLDLDKAAGHRLVGRGERMDPAPVSGLTAARERQAIAAADARELANAERRKTLVDREAVKLALDDILVRVRSAVLSVAGRSAPKVAAVADVAICRQILDNELRAALSDLAAADDIHQAFLA